MSLNGRLFLDPSSAEVEAHRDAHAPDAAPLATTSGNNTAAASSGAEPAPIPSSIVSVAYMPNLRQISSISQSGNSSAKEVNQVRSNEHVLQPCMMLCYPSIWRSTLSLLSSLPQLSQLTHLCVAGCEQLSGLMRDCIIDAAKRKSNDGQANK